jgi:ribose transport system substrate-binding protein
MPTVRPFFRRSTAQVGVIAIVIASAALAACSSSTTGAGSSPTNAGPGTTGTSGTSLAACVSQATSLTKASLASGAGDPYPTAPASAAAVKGKTYWMISLSQSVTGDVLMSQGFEAAAKAAGANVHVYDGKGLVPTIVQGVNTAIAAKAAGIVLLNVDTAWVTNQLAAAKAAGIPVIVTNNGSLITPAPLGVAAQATPSNITAGKLQADYALYATSCKLNAIFVTSLSAPSAKAITDGAQSEISRLCPTGCKTTVVNVAPADIATDLPGLVESALQRDPSANMIIDGSDTAYVPGIQVAQKALGTKVPIVSNIGSGIPPESGVPIIADTVSGTNAINGWYYFDAALRVANGQTGVMMQIPTILVDRSTWGTGAPPFVPPSYADYQKAFEKLWGVSS